MAKAPPRWLVRANTVLLARGLRVGSQHLLTVRGRTTGKPRRTPVSVVTLDGGRFIVAAFESANWVRNVRAASSGTLRGGGEVEEVLLVELPTIDRASVLRAFHAQVRGGHRFFDAREPDRIVAAANRYPVFRIVSGT
jgi:deazaflavin-dependent oxidoreductase (nitroreductase family)